MSELLGRHLLVELYDCDRDRLDDLEFLKAEGVAAAEAMGATVMAVHAHRYEPQGVSVVILLAESHLSLHTWPEHGTASLDVYVCGRTNDPHRARRLLGSSLAARRFADLEVERGRLDRQSAPAWRAGIV